MEPKPQGEPAAIAAVAAQFAHYAARLEQLAHGAPAILPLPAFVGPGRASHDRSFEAIAGDARAAAGVLADEAAALKREGEDLDRRQRDWERRKKAEEDRRKADASKFGGASGSGRGHAS